MLWNFLVTWFFLSYFVIGYFVYKLEASYNCSRWHHWREHLFNWALWWVTVTIRIVQMAWQIPGVVRERLQTRREEREKQRVTTS